MAKVLLLEDDADLSGLIVKHLEDIHCQVEACENGLDGLSLARKKAYDLILLDLGLPGMDGVEICRKYRAGDELTPILMLTARDSEADRVLGLEMGADDYLGKPFSIRELQARVKAILRRQNLMLENAHASRLIFDSLEVDLDKRLVRCLGKEVNLTAKEFDLLYFLALNAGKVYNREQLLNHVWGYTNSIYEHTVNSNINRLRSKLEIDSTRPEFILTVRGVGYKFNEAMAGR